MMSSQEFVSEIYDYFQNERIAHSEEECLCELIREKLKSKKYVFDLMQLLLKTKISSDCQELILKIIEKLLVIYNDELPLSFIFNFLVNSSNEMEIEENVLDCLCKIIGMVGAYILKKDKTFMFNLNDNNAIIINSLIIFLEIVEKENLKNLLGNDVYYELFMFAYDHVEIYPNVISIMVESLKFGNEKINSILMDHYIYQNLTNLMFNNLPPLSSNIIYFFKKIIDNLQSFNVHEKSIIVNNIYLTFLEIVKNNDIFNEKENILAFNQLVSSFESNIRDFNKIIEPLVDFIYNKISNEFINSYEMLNDFVNFLSAYSDIYGDNLILNQKCYLILSVLIDESLKLLVNEPKLGKQIILNNYKITKNIISVLSKISKAKFNNTIYSTISKYLLNPSNSDVFYHIDFLILCITILMENWENYEFCSITFELISDNNIIIDDGIIIDYYYQFLNIFFKGKTSLIPKMQFFNDIYSLISNIYYKLLFNLIEEKCYKKSKKSMKLLLKDDDNIMLFGKTNIPHYIFDNLFLFPSKSFIYYSTIKIIIYYEKEKLLNLLKENIDNKNILKIYKNIFLNLQNKAKWIEAYLFFDLNIMNLYENINSDDLLSFVKGFFNSIPSNDIFKSYQKHKFHLFHIFIKLLTKTLLAYKYDFLNYNISFNLELKPLCDIEKPSNKNQKFLLNMQLINRLLHSSFPNFGIIKFYNDKTIFDFLDILISKLPKQLYVLLNDPDLLYQILLFLKILIEHFNDYILDNNFYFDFFVDITKTSISSSIKEIYLYTSMLLSSILDNDKLITRIDKFKIHFIRAINLSFLSSTTNIFILKFIHLEQNFAINALTIIEEEIEDLNQRNLYHMSLLKLLGSKIYSFEEFNSNYSIFLNDTHSLNINISNMKAFNNYFQEC